MKIKNLIGWILGSICIMLILLGLSTLLFPQVFALVISIIMICLSLAIGMLLPNPISLCTLILGVIMIFIPHLASGIILICLGLIGALANLIVFLAIRKK